MPAFRRPGPSAMAMIPSSLCPWLRLPQRTQSVNRYAARRDREIRPPRADIAPMAWSPARTLPLIAACAAVVNRLAAITAGDPLAVTPDDHRLKETLMLEATRHPAGHRHGCLGVGRRRRPEQRRKQQGQDQPNHRPAHAPLP